MDRCLEDRCCKHWKYILELCKINKEAKVYKEIHMAEEKDSKKQMFESIGTKNNPTNTISSWIVRASE